MIISASRRTDIPACYSRWFLEKLRTGWLEVANPYNPKQKSRISLIPEDVTAFVFWSKNPQPLISFLPDLKRYHYYFLFTINPYSAEIEPGLPSLESRIDTFRRLSELIGADSVIWRYDPVFLSSEIGLDFHHQSFAYLSRKLGRFTERCILSFLDLYRKNQKICTRKGIRIPTLTEKTILLEHFVETAGSEDFSLTTCAEESIIQPGLTRGKCIDNELISRLTGADISYRKDQNQRNNCLCHLSRDIGSYKTCLHKCIYCYAN